MTCRLNVLLARCTKPLLLLGIPLQGSLAFLTRIGLLLLLLVVLLRLLLVVLLRRLLLLRGVRTTATYCWGAQWNGKAKQGEAFMFGRDPLVTLRTASFSSCSPANSYHLGIVTPTKGLTPV